MKENAIEYFKFHRKIFCDDYLKICPKDSIAYQATLKEKEFYDMAIKALEQEPKTGHWISHREHCENLGIMMPNSIDVYEWCSNCDCGIDVREWYRSNYNYCPNCGAKMESEVDNGNDSI